MEDHPGGVNPVEAAGRCSAPQVGEEPSYVVWREGCGWKTAEEGGVVDGVKGLRKVDGHSHRPPWGTLLVEACHHMLDEREQAGIARTTRLEAVLCVSEG